MSLLKWNQKKVQNLTPSKIWMFIAGRVLAAFGIGVLAMQYFPQITGWSGIPALILGFILLVIATKGMARKSPPSNQDPAG